MLSPRVLPRHWDIGCRLLTTIVSRVEHENSCRAVLWALTFCQLEWWVASRVPELHCVKASSLWKEAETVGTDS